LTDCLPPLGLCSLAASTTSVEVLSESVSLMTMTTARLTALEARARETRREAGEGEVTVFVRAAGQRRLWRALREADRDAPRSS